jgi:hypothetical protein
VGHRDDKNETITPMVLTFPVPISEFDCYEAGPDLHNEQQLNFSVTNQIHQFNLGVQLIKSEMEKFWPD